MRDNFKNDAAGRVLKWLRDHEQDMLRVLEEVVNIDSGSTNKAGVDRVGHVFCRELARSAIQTTVYPIDKYGNCILAEIPGTGSASAPHALLLGHMDTVFPVGTVEQRPYRVESEIAYGPGVADMKAGLVMNTFIARAFAETQSNTSPIKVFYTGDEEIASPASRELTLRFAAGAMAVLNAEPGRPSGNVVIRRKGAFFIDFEVEGVAAHAGVNHAKGASAIEALAQKVIELHALTDRTSGVTANVGVISGGVSVNTVAPHAKAQLDVRYPVEVDQEELYRRILNIVEKQSISCTCSRIIKQGRFLPLFQTAQSKSLFEDYVASAKNIGLVVDGESTGGSADSGFTAFAGAPTLCATGPIGENVHTPQEFCRLDTIVPRAQVIALTLLLRQMK